MYYNLLINQSIFILVGFGFFVSYLKFHRWMSLTMTIYILCLTIQAWILFTAFWEKWFYGGWK